MKIVDINRLIKKHLRPNLLGYSVHRDLLYKLESDFFIKGYYFESRGNEDLDLAVWYFVQPLFAKVDSIVLTLGGRLCHPIKQSLFKTKESDWWDARRENLNDSFESIFDTISSRGEKFLNPEITPELFYKKYYPKRKDNVTIFEVVAYTTVLFANEDLQKKTIKSLIDFCTSQIDSSEDEVEIQIRKDAVFLLNQDSTTKRVEVLKSWANETIGCLKLPQLKPFV